MSVDLVFFSIANIIYPNPRCVKSGDTQTIECVSIRAITVNKNHFNRHEALSLMQLFTLKKRHQS